MRDYILKNPDIVINAARKVKAREEQAEEQIRREAASAVRQVDNQDHIRGNASAPVRVVEYSDFERPFCKSFHPTLKQIMDKYAKDGKVAATCAPCQMMK